MKIYTVYEGKIESLEVRETKELFISEKTCIPAFDFKMRWYKREACTTPKEAIKKELERLYNSQTKYRANLVKVNTHIKELKILRREHEFKTGNRQMASGS